MYGRRKCIIKFIINNLEEEENIYIICKIFNYWKKYL